MGGHFCSLFNTFSLRLVQKRYMRNGVGLETFGISIISRNITNKHLIAFFDEPFLA